MASEFQTVSQTDVIWAGGSIVFVLLYIGIHTRSIFLACTGVSVTPSPL